MNKRQQQRYDTLVSHGRGQVAKAMMELQEAIDNYNIYVDFYAGDGHIEHACNAGPEDGCGVCSKLIELDLIAEGGN